MYLSLIKVRHEVMKAAMATYYKRKVAKEIVKLLKSKTHFHSEIDLQRLEHKVRKIVKIRPAKKESIIYPSLSVNANQLKDVIPQGNIDIDLLQDKLQFEASPNGYVGFLTERDAFLEAVLGSIKREADNYGYVDSNPESQRVCVEFSSPNVAKPFHVGHLRSTIIGNVVSNLYEAAGHDVKRINFLGDWGTQFGLLTLGLRKYCDEDKLAQDPLLEILKTYVQINKDVKAESGSGPVMSSPSYQQGMELFASLEKGDEELLSIWSRLKKITVSELDRMYERLGVKFTHTHCESDYRHSTQDVVARLQEANRLQFGEDGVGYVSVSDEDQGRASVVKSDGSSLYLTRDIAAALDRQTQFGLDRMHYVVEMGQRGHFSKLVEILKDLGVPWAQRPLEEVHIRFGRVQGMSTRRGQAVHLQEVLDQARSKVILSMQARESTRVTEDLERVADRLAVSSIILQDLKSHRAKDYSFSWDRMLNFKADSGVFVQYCHARLCSMVDNCGFPLAEDVDVGVLLHEDSLVHLVIHMARYPEVFDHSLETVEPHHIVQFLFKLCHLSNAAYAVSPVKGQSADVAQARLLVFDCARQVISNCLRVLGISPLTQI